MHARFWDGIEALIAEQAYTSEVPVSIAVRSACRTYPDAPIQNLTLAMASLATSLETEWIAGPLSEQKALLQIYQEILELSVDLAFSQLQGKDILSCRDLLRHRENEMKERHLTP